MQFQQHHQNKLETVKIITLSDRGLRQSVNNPAAGTTPNSLRQKGGNTMV